MIREYFGFSRCADETFSKPHPQMLEELLDLTGLEANQVLMIGDTEHDLQMALNADIDAIAVTYGAQNVDYLLTFKPQACFNDISELPRWLLGSEV